MKRESGFTLVEIIVAIVIVAILAAVVGSGIVQGVRYYLFAKENAEMNQKAQIALERIRREMMEIADVTAITSSSIEFDKAQGSRKIGVNGGALKIARDATALADGDIIIDNVSSLVMTYKKGDGTGWSDVSDDKSLFRIQIVLSLTHGDPDLGAVTFTTAINPRNTGNYIAPASTSTTTTTTTTTTVIGTTTTTGDSTSSTTTTTGTGTTTTTDTSTTTSTTTTTTPPGSTLQAFGGFACKKNTGTNQVSVRLYLMDGAGNPVAGATVEWRVDGVFQGYLTEQTTGFYGGIEKCLCGAYSGSSVCENSVSSYLGTVTVSITASKTGYATLEDSITVPN